MKLASKTGEACGDEQMLGDVLVDRRLDFGARDQVAAAQRERGRVGIGAAGIGRRRRLHGQADDHDAPPEEIPSGRNLSGDSAW